jgi:hypothetical protein
VSQPRDPAIRALVRSVAQATVELCVDGLHEEPALQHAAAVLNEARTRIADKMADVVMTCADDDPESEVHAVRRS